MYELHDLNIGTDFSTAVAPVLLDTNVIVDGKAGLERAANSAFITPSVFAEAHGVARHRGLRFNAGLFRTTGKRNTCLEDNREEYSSILYQDQRSFENNLDSISESMHSNEQDDKLDSTAKELAHDRMARQYLSNMITKAIAGNHDKLDSGKDALRNIVTDAELVYLSVYSAMKGHNPILVSDDSDVPKIMYLVWNEARARGKKLCERLETLDEDSREYKMLNMELDMLQEIECAKVRFSNPVGFSSGNVYGRSLKETAMKTKEMM